MKHEVVFAVYKPKKSKESRFKKVLSSHVPALKKARLITNRKPILVQSRNGEYVEIFEWKNSQAAMDAHHHPVIKKIWKDMGGVCTFTSLSKLKEAKRPFAHFKPVKFR